MGDPITEVEDLGRAALLLSSQRPEIRSLNIPCPDKWIITVPEKETELTLRHCSLSIRSAAFSSGLLVLKHDMPDDFSNIAEVLDVLCSDRERFLVNGQKFTDWVRNQNSDLANSKLGKDVFQIVALDEDATKVLRDTDGGPSAITQALIQREKIVKASTQNHSIRTPKELNRNSNQFCAHGRGVMVVAGLLDPPVEVILFVASQLLLAIGQIREIRNTLQETFTKIRTDQSSPQTHRSIAEIRSWTEKIRLFRARLVLDIIPAVNGLDSPITLLDNFRDSFGASLRVTELLNSGISMLDTLSQIAEIDLKETQIDAAKKADARERNWRFLVSFVSGLVVPVALALALALAFFSVGTSMNVSPRSSMFDWNRYWFPLSTTALAMVSVSIFSAVKFYLSSPRRSDDL